MVLPEFVTPYNAIALSLFIGSAGFAAIQIQMFVDRKNRAARREERLYREQYEASGSHTENHALIIGMGGRKGLDENQLGVLDARLLGQVKLAIAQAIHARQATIRLSGTAMVMPTVAAFVSAASGTLPAGQLQTNALLIVALLNAVAGIAQIVLTLQGYQKIWFESRKIVQLVTKEIYDFLGNVDPYDDLTLDIGFETMLSRSQSHISTSQQSLLQLIEAGARAAEETKSKKREDGESDRVDRAPLKASQPEDVAES
jgi:Protein of unknown function (DUF4231)